MKSSILKNIFVRSCLTVLLCAMCCSRMIAQSDTVAASQPTPRQPLKIGFFGGVNGNYHLANFANIVGLQFITSPEYQAQFGRNLTKPDTTFSPVFSLTPNVGIAVESSFSPLFGMAARLSFATHNALFSVDEAPVPYFDPNKDSFAIVQFQRSYNTSLVSLALEPLFMFTPAGGLKIYAGGRVGYMLTRNVVRAHTPLFDAPLPPLILSLAQFFNSTIPNADPLTLSVMAGIGYDIPLDFIKLDAAGQGKLILAPEVFGMWGLNQVAPVETGAWNLHQLRAGIALFYRKDEVAERLEERRIVDTIEVQKKLIRIPFMVGISRFVRDTVNTVENGVPTRLIRETLFRRDTVFITPPPKMDVAITAVGVEANGTEKPIVQVRFEEFLAQRYVPLLNYVFFDDQAFALPARYKRLTSPSSSLFDVDKLYKSGTLDIYYHVLNIVGKRMRQYPEAILTLTGCNADLGGEAGNTALSEERAETIRRYLIEVWDIAGNRLIAKARNLSELASMPKTEVDKIEENRRVELTSTMHEILDPVELSDTVRTSNPPIVRFKMNAKTDQPVNDWTLLVNYHDEEIKRFTNDSANPELPKRLDWLLLQEGDSVLKTQGPLQFILTARDAVGKSGFAHGMIPVEQLTLRKKRKEYRNDREFEQFSLILFNFNKSEISERNKNIIDFMKDRIKPTSLFSIAGYTDRTGDAAYNRTLSRQRASELARLLGAPASAAQGFGEDQLLYTNDLPEGRFYCRTVNVSIETPVKYRE
jgi:outer membrane protein OmpA-like peptidoglycan-associated protein